MGFIRSQRGGGFGFVVVVFLAVSIAPASWLGWTGDVADVVRAPIMPLSRAGTSIASWLRPPRGKRCIGLMDTPELIQRTG